MQSKSDIDGKCMPQSRRESKQHKNAGMRGSLGQRDPLLIALLLGALLMVGLAVTAWRYVALRDRPASTYYEFQIQRWEELLTSEPDNPAIWATLGSLYEKNGDDRRAEEAFTRALELDEENVAALVYKADQFLAEGDVDRARSMLTSAAAGLPEGGRYSVLFDLGELERTNGDDDAAMQAYLASYADNQTFWNAPYRLAFLFRAKGQDELALAAAVSAQRFAPDNDALGTLVDELEAEGVKQESADALLEYAKGATSD